MIEGLSPDLAQRIRDDSFYEALKLYNESGAFEFAELKLGFDQLLKEVDMEMDAYSEGRYPSLFWREVFYRLHAKDQGHEIAEVPEEVRHVAGEYLVKEKVNNEEIEALAESTAKSFRDKEIKDYKFDGKFRERIKVKAPISMERVEKALIRYQDKVRRAE